MDLIFVARLVPRNMNSDEYDELFLMKHCVVFYDGPNVTLMYPRVDAVKDYIRADDFDHNLRAGDFNCLYHTTVVRFRQISSVRTAYHNDVVRPVSFWIRDCFQAFVTRELSDRQQQKVHLAHILAEIGACRQPGWVKNDFSVTVHDLKVFAGDLFGDNKLLQRLARGSVKAFPNLRIKCEKIKGLYRIWYEPEYYEIPPSFTRNHFLNERIAVALLKALEATIHHPVSHDVMLNSLLVVPVFLNDVNYLKFLLKRLPLRENPGRVGVGMNVREDRLKVNRTSAGSFYLFGDLGLVGELGDLSLGMLNIQLGNYKDNICNLLFACCGGNRSVRKDVVEQRVLQDNQFEFVHISVFWHIAGLLISSIVSFHGKFVNKYRDLSTGFDMLSIVENPLPEVNELG